MQGDAPLFPPLHWASSASPLRPRIPPGSGPVPFPHAQLSAEVPEGAPLTQKISGELSARQGFCKLCGKPLPNGGEA